MSYTFELNGQVITLTDSEMRALVRRLMRYTRFQVWNQVSSPFSHSYRRWQWHYNRRNDPIHWITEAVGRATLPSTSMANRVKRMHDRLDRSISAEGIVHFYDNLNAWQRDAARFRRAMRDYLNSFDAGGGRVVRTLTITRDASFITLQVCAGLLTGGASAGASAAALATTEGAAMALARTAATGFVINEMQNSATRLGRTLAGEQVTTQDTLREIGNNALSSASDAMLGEILGHFMAPLKDEITAAAMREIRSGRLLQGVAIETVNDRMESAITDAINDLRAVELRSALRDTPRAGSARECARSTSRHLMANRRFRQQLEQNLQR